MSKIPMKWHGTRSMLNGVGHHSTAAIVAEVQDMAHVPADCRDFWTARPETVLQISDCSRAITIDFDWDSEDDRINDLAKVDILIDSLKQFRKGLVTEQRRFAKFQNRVKEESE